MRSAFAHSLSLKFRRSNLSQRGIASIELMHCCTLQFARHRSCFTTLMSSFAVISTFSVIPTERSPRHYWNKNCMCLKIAGITTIVNQHHVFFRFESKDRSDDRFWKQSAGSRWLRELWCPLFRLFWKSRMQQQVQRICLSAARRRSEELAATLRAELIRPRNLCRFESKNWSVAHGRHWQLLLRTRIGVWKPVSSSSVL